MFHFKHFSIQQKHSALKVGTDAMIFGALLEHEGSKTGLDIGAGTGVLSLMVAQKNEHIAIDAIELDAGAQQDCQYNFDHSPWSNRLTLISADFLLHSFHKQYDFIFSNPPFYQHGEVSNDAQTALSKHSTFLPFDQLFAKVAHLLSSDGICWFILPSQFEEQVLKLAADSHLFLYRQIMLEAKPQRIKRAIFAFGKSHRVPLRTHFLLRNDDNSYSMEYIKSTNDFHGIDITQHNQSQENEPKG